MKKIINDPADVVPQMLAGLLLAHPELTAITKNAVAAVNSARKVNLISGGGSGHEPLDIGFVGAGLLDVAILGDVFTPPTTAAIVEAVQQLDPNTPVLMIVKNFVRDTTNFSRAQSQLIAAGYTVQTLVVADDQSVNPTTHKRRERGVAGTVLLFKLLGAAADQGADLATLVTLGNQALHQLYTLGVALAGTEAPGQSEPAFALPDDKIAYGIGIHGEPGYRSEPLVSSELLARELVNKLLQAANLPPHQAVALMVNGLGGLPLMDQAIFTNDAVQLLRLAKVDPQFVKTGTFLTSYGMRGLSLTLLRLEPNWLPYLTASVGGFGW